MVSKRPSAEMHLEIYHKIHPFILLVLILSSIGNEVANAAALGSLEFASIHEAGHMTVANSVGYPGTNARVFQNFKTGVGTFWKGQTTFTERAITRGMALVKLGGIFSEHFLSDSNRIFQPGFLDVIGHRDVISQSDRITSVDLAGHVLLEAQRKTFLILKSRVADLDQVYKALFYNHKYPR